MTQPHQPPATSAQHPWPPPPEPRNGFGLTALILGILSLLFSLAPITGFIAVGLGATGLVFAFANVGRLRRGVANNKSVTSLGGVLSGLGLFLGIVSMSMFFNAVNDLGNELEDISNDLNSYSECIERADTPEEIAACD